MSNLRRSKISNAEIYICCSEGKIEIDVNEGIIQALV
jgi:hypothetical protein